MKEEDKIKLDTITGNDKIANFVGIYNKNNETIKNAVDTCKEDIETLYGELNKKISKDGLKSEIDTQISKSFDTQIQEIQSNYSNFKDDVHTALDGIVIDMSNLKKDMKSLNINELKLEVKTYVDSLKENINNDFDNTSNKLKEEVIESINTDISKTQEKISEFEKMYKTISDKFNNFDESIKNIHTALDGFNLDLAKLKTNFEELNNKLSNNS